MTKICLFGRELSYLCRKPNAFGSKQVMKSVAHSYLALFRFCVFTVEVLVRRVLAVAISLYFLR